MYRISDDQIDLILADITDRGIATESLRDNLLDHICILIEEGLEDGGDFEAFYATVIRSFYRQDLCELEEEANLLIRYKHHWALSRSRFFLLLFALVLGPFFWYDTYWFIDNRQAAGWTLPAEIWASTIVFMIFPLLVLLVLLLTPERFDPLIPRRSTVLLGMRPLIKVVPA